MPALTREFRTEQDLGIGYNQHLPLQESVWFGHYPLNLSMPTNRASMPSLTPEFRTEWNHDIDYNQDLPIQDNVPFGHYPLDPEADPMLEFVNLSPHPELTIDVPGQTPSAETSHNPVQDSPEHSTPKPVEQSRGTSSAPYPPSPLEKAKDKLSKRYHKGLEIMCEKEVEETGEINPDKIARSIYASYSILRPDLEIFTKDILHTWLEKGLWPHTAPGACDELWKQCSIDMMHLEIEQDPETKAIMRRVAQIRMYYWFEEEKKKLDESSNLVKLDSDEILHARTSDTFFRYFSTIWDKADDISKKVAREKFDTEVETGKKWLIGKISRPRKCARFPSLSSIATRML
ncbi:hypothetical protein BDV37DRAFT_292988 [Aspergillus pseudonomiae]|uniref:Uncharacterized protein n=1 Tax=Aspergillus pseudonomiae TaxID=1506151 RepID=A0A5N7CRP5_9EURO|nr:uncharacterized protein BDV37DRAFT_292988 [Aspergillus pseudonomiae]KAE8396910.1 hypothetical protein BDV37DRAFT_292988 [Aspergillus pseudonomiae]